MQSVSFAFSGRKPRAAGEHYQQTEILSGVMPGTPADVQREDPGQERIPEVSDETGKRQQHRNVHRKKTVSREFIVGVIGTVNGGHEMRVVEEQGEQVKSERPPGSPRTGDIRRKQQERGRPGAAADQQIEPWFVNPQTVGRYSIAGFPAARGGGGGGRNGIVEGILIRG